MVKAGKCVAWIDDVWQGDTWKNNQHGWSCQGAKNVELALACLITNPIELHINHFGAFLLDGVIDDATCSAVIHL